MEQQKGKKKLNIVDALAVILLLAAVVYIGLRLANRGSGSGTEPAPTVSVSYTVQCKGVDAALYESCQKHLPSQLMASGQLYNGSITTVRQEKYLVLSDDGAWVEDPARTTLYFTVEATIPEQTVLTTEIAKQEVRVGKSDYILKSEYIEFKDAVITDVEWNR